MLLSHSKRTKYDDYKYVQLTADIRVQRQMYVKYLQQNGGSQQKGAGSQL